MKRYLAVALVVLIMMTTLVACTDAVPLGTSVTTAPSGAVTSKNTSLVIVTDSSNNGYSDIHKPTA